VVGASSPSASTQAFWHPGHDEPPGSRLSSTTWRSRSVADRRPAWRGGWVLPVSKDTLLRAVRRRSSPHPVPPTVVGIDDWAWRRNRRYGTIICDLERRRTIALLPDREPATAQDWLSGQKQIAVVARDRGGSYALAAAKALPHATQVADRWHLMENASRAFLDAVRTSMRQIRGLSGISCAGHDDGKEGTHAWHAAKHRLSLTHCSTSSLLAVIRKPLLAGTAWSTS